MPAGLDVRSSYAAMHPHRDPESLALTSVILRCLESDPADRVQSARELHDALAEVRDPAAWTRDDAEAFWLAVDRARYVSSEMRAVTSIVPPLAPSPRAP